MGSLNTQILLVDDDSLIVWTTSSLLTHQGYEVYSAGSMGQALCLLESAGVPDLILTDYFLPDATGAELIEAVRSKLSATIPAIVTTGAFLDTRDNSCWPSDCLLLQKPVPFATLQATLQELLNRPS